MSTLTTTEQSPQVQVLPSNIDGHGLFASELISADTFIGRYEGPVTYTDGHFVLWILNDDAASFGIDGRNDLRFVNHCSSPNATFDGAELWTLRDIEPGEEITVHYGDDWAEDETTEEPDYETSDTADDSNESVASTHASHTPSRRPPSQQTGARSTVNLYVPIRPRKLRRNVT